MKTIDPLNFVLPEKKENIECEPDCVENRIQLPKEKNKSLGSKPYSFTKKNKQRKKTPKRNGLNKQRNKK